MTPDGITGHLLTVASSTSNTNSPLSGTFENGVFAAVLEDCKHAVHTDSTGLYTAAASGDDNHRRYYRHLYNHQHPRLTDSDESVNSIGGPSENRHDAGAATSRKNDASEQRPGGNPSDFQHDSPQHRSGQQRIHDINHRNNEIIGVGTTVAAAPLRMVQVASVSSMMLPNKEMKKLVRVLRDTSLSKRTNVLLTLDLNEFGEVKLDVTLKAKKVFITAHIMDRRAAAALSYAVGELKKQLDTIDLTLEKFEITTGKRSIASAASSPTPDAIILSRGKGKRR
ncbi:MAG: hypothetical protein JXR76_07345 [Deltaproteobacteria bacterium]|nr:hypothetical protein [Deltaproteobacteria bacterium]